ncbi:MAG: hypothetical protein WC865_01405 [Bacteroidales bacterium]
MEAFHCDTPTITSKAGNSSVWEILAALALILPLIYILKTEVELNHKDDKNA